MRSLVFQLQASASIKRGRGVSVIVTNQEMILVAGLHIDWDLNWFLLGLLPEGGLSQEQ